MYKEMKKIVEVRNKHGNGDEFPDFADIYIFFGIKNVRVGGKILGSVGRSEAYIFFFGLINFARDSRLISGFLMVLQFPLPKNLTATI
jgi:hypothetical protein